MLHCIALHALTEGLKDLLSHKVCVAATAVMMKRVGGFEFPRYLSRAFLVKMILLV